MATRNELLIGALLHDIGKFMQRAHHGSRLELPEGVQRLRPELRYEHALWTRFFFDGNLIAWPADVDPVAIARLASRHHKPTTAEETIIQRADCLSAGHDRPEKAGEDGEPSPPRHFTSVPLASIFASLEGRPTEQGEYVHPLEPLEGDLGCIFPESCDSTTEEITGDLSPEYRELWTKFCNALRNIRAPSAPALVAAISSALARYTWCIPASTQDPPCDVSLYDHARTTAAIAACLQDVLAEQGHLADPTPPAMPAAPFLLLTGDLSGIQKYLFDISEVGVGGTARRLRGRSFTLSLLAEIAAMKVLRAFDLTPLNILLNSGGAFTLLLPNLRDAERRLLALRAELDRWSLSTLHGQVRINLAWVSSSEKDLHSECVAGLIENLQRQLQQAKASPLGSALRSDMGWREENFLLGPADATYRPCRVCGKLPAEAPEDGSPVCALCRQDAEVGRSLPDAVAVAIHPHGTEAKFELLDAGFDIVRHGAPIRAADWIIALNPFDLPDKVAAPVWPRSLAQTVPRQNESECKGCCAADDCDIPPEERPREGDILPFSCLARRGEGRKALGWLKGDVDRLGQTIAFGFPERTRSLSRIATLSRMLDLFFSSYVNHLLAHDFRDTYTVFSGGDDFFFVGPWNEVIHLASKLREDFREFTCGRLTFSAAHVLTRDRTPTAIAAPQVSKRLEEAKDCPALGVKERKEGRDQVSLFGLTLEWDDLARALADAQRLSDWLRNDTISASMARRLLIYAQMWRRWKRDSETANLRFLPLLAYDLARNWQPRGPDDAERCEALEWASRLREPTQDAFRWLPVALQYAMNTQR